MLQQIVNAIRDILRNHKLKIAAALGFALIFSVLLFPFGDLSDLVTAKVSEATGGALYVQFDEMGLSLIPSVGVKMDNVVIESPQLPSLTADSVSFSPWILGALGAKMGGTLDAEGLFKGNVRLVLHEGEKLKSEARAKNIDVEATEIALPAVSEFLRSGNLLSLVMQGNLALNTNLKVDPTFKEQPDGTLGLNISGFTLPSQSFNTQMGPVQSPNLRLGKVAMKAKLKSGRLEIEDMTFGGAKEDLSGKIKGELGLILQPDGTGGVRPIVSSYDLKIDLMASKAFMDPSINPASGLLNGFLGQYKSESPQGTRFAFRLRPPKIPGMPPEIGAIQ